MIHVERIVNSVFTSNMYVITSDDSNDVWLVDVGDFHKVTDILSPSSIVKGVFLTHTHFDHIYGINMLLVRFPAMGVYLAEQGKEALYSSKKNLSYYHESPLVFEGENVHLLKEGDKVKIFNELEIYPIGVPGHTIDSMAFLLGNALFTGDAYIPNTPVVTNLPTGNKMQAYQSRMRIIDVAKGKTIYPGHGDSEVM